MNILLGLIVLGTATAWSVDYWRDKYSAPVKYLSLVALSRVVVPGGSVVFRATIDRRQNCPGTADRFFTALGGSQAVVYRDTVPYLPTTLGEGVSYTFTVPVPNSVPPDTYVFNEIVRFDCDGSIHTVELPSASFRVCDLTDVACKE